MAGHAGAEIDGQVEALRERVAALEHEVDEQRRHRAALTRELESARFRADNLDNDLRRVARDHRLTERHVRNITHQRDVMAASLSWAVTAPLRALSAAIRRLADAAAGEAVRCDLDMARQIVAADGEWQMRAVGSEPWLAVHAPGVQLDRGWMRIRFRIEAESDYMLDPRVGFDHDAEERTSVSVPVDAWGYVDEILPVAAGARSLWIQPCRYEGAFTIEDVRALGLSATQARLHLGLRRLSRLLRRPKEPASGHRTYRRWTTSFDTLTDDDRARIVERCRRLPCTPLVSVLMPVYNVDVRWLERAIDSVRRQLYPHWELCIADDGSTATGVRDTLDRYGALDRRIKVCHRAEHGHIAAASNSALALAAGDFVALLDHDDELTEHALYLVAEEVNAHPAASVIYSDEDKIDRNGQRYDPYFKPDWNLDLFYSHNLISHLGVYRRSLVHDAGGFRAGSDGSQDYDLALRCIERIDAARIRHIPFVLYHWRAIAGSAASGASHKGYAYAAARRALADHFERRGMTVDVIEAFPGSALHRVKHALPADPPLVSLIVPTRDRADLLARAVGGILARTDYPRFEIVIVDNDSRERETAAYLDDISRHDPRVRVARHGGAFNFPALCNAGVRHARGDVVGLVNNDVDVIGRDWLTEMVSHAVRQDVGVVGAMLYYPDNTIQHAGIALGIGGIAGHMHKRMHRGTTGYVGRAQLVQNVSAVTAACCVVRRCVYEQIGGLDEQLGVAFNDVDFCLRAVAAGYRNVWTPYAELYHFESSTRGSDRTGAQALRLDEEATLMRRRFGDRLRADPAYSPNLTLDTEDLSLAFPPRVHKAWR